MLELVKTTTADGIRLDGVLNRCPGAAALELDAIIGLHGVGSNFYGSAILEGLSNSLAASGISVLRANTRGHDTITMVSTPSGPRRIGAAYEIVDECRLDVAAWVKWLTQQGFRRLGLFGHSLGAIKSLYATAHEPLDAIRCVVAASAPRLSFSAFANGPTSADFLEAMATAQLHVRQNQPLALFETKVPFPLLVGASAFVDKYGREDRYNILRFLNQVHPPTLFTYGGLELERGGIAFTGLPGEIRQRQQPGQDFTCVTIADADHFYTGVRERLTDAIHDWLRAKFAPG